MQDLFITKLLIIRMLKHDNSNPESRAERSKLWKEDGQAMDPFDRQDFWGKNGFRVMAFRDSSGNLCAVPYAQISMDPTELEDSCETLWAGIKVMDQSLMQTGSTISADLYRGLYKSFQGTIDENLHLYPEYARVYQQLKDVKEVVLLDPRTDEGRAAMERAVSQKDALKDVDFDIRYCQTLLKRQDLDPEQREIAECNLKRSKEKKKELQ